MRHTIVGAPGVNIERTGGLSRAVQIRIIRQFGTEYRDVTEMARVELGHEGWLRDGSLSGDRLVGANLSRADLRGADLIGADLPMADLSDAILWVDNVLWVSIDRDRRSIEISGSAKLDGAYLWGANLSGVKLPPDLVIDPDKWKAIIIESRTLRWSRD